MAEGGTFVHFGSDRAAAQVASATDGKENLRSGGQTRARERESKESGPYRATNGVTNESVRVCVCVSLASIGVSSCSPLRCYSCGIDILTGPFSRIPCHVHGTHTHIYRYM